MLILSLAWGIFGKNLLWNVFEFSGGRLKKIRNAMLYNLYLYKTLIFHGATIPSGQGLPHYRGFTITLRHTTLGRTLLDE
jgi:hypothetical protein